MILGHVGVEFDMIMTNSHVKGLGAVGRVEPHGSSEDTCQVSEAGW